MSSHEYGMTHDQHKSDFQQPKRKKIAATVQILIELET